DRFPTWAPDGNRIAFTSDRDGDDEVYVMNVDDTGHVRLTQSAALDVLDSWRR
ncbi:MAG: TolB protein, partial [Geminicoccaceae bacterium]|nr:TolB protein [Geminicoccaceae bacterium]